MKLLTTASCVGALAALAMVGAGVHQQARRPIPAATAARIGCLAPNFELADRSGRRWRLSDRRGRPTVLFFACGCSDCRLLLNALSHARVHDVLVISSSLSPALNCPAPEGGTCFPVLFDAFSDTASAYSSLRCPALWLVNPDGIIAHASQPGGRDPGEVAARVLRWCRQGRPR